MSRQEQTNTFQDGIMTDMHPLSANNTTMTDAKNATIITYNGNEMILQNDMGNSKIKVSKDSNDYVKLTEGFKPLGVVEHGGILYIASTDGTNFELGSFPGPEFDDPKEEYIGLLTDESFSEKGIISGSNKASIVKPNTTTFEECFLDRILLLYYVNGDKEEPVTLSAGLNFIIDVLSYHTLTKDNDNNDNNDNNDKKKFYKIRFINIDNGLDITELLKFAINYITTKEPNSSIDKYFPNISNVKLGVKFELEDIEFFDLGVTTELENSKIPHKDYNGGRFPYLLITNEGNYAIFQRIEFKTNSEIKVNFVDIDWKLISKSSENKDTDEELSGSFRQRLGNPNDDKYELKDMRIKIPNNLNWYLEYTIYPQWKNLPSSENLFTREHLDYNKTLGKYKKHNIIDLSLNPSLWGATEEYSDDNEDFKIHRYLSKDLFLSGMEGADLFKLGLSVKGKQENYFDFIEAHKEKEYTFTIDESKKEDSIEYVGCLNEKSLDFTEVFPNVDVDLYGWISTTGFHSWYYDAPLSMYQIISVDDFTHKVTNSKQKKCKIHNFIHRNYIKSKELNYTKFYNILVGKCCKNINGFLLAEKHAPYIIYGLWDQVPGRMSHIETDKIALSPLLQHQELSLYDESSVHDNIDVLSTWKKLASPISGAPFTAIQTNLEQHVTAHFGRYGQYNYNERSSDAMSYFNEYYKNKTVDLDIELKDGSMNLNILTNFLCLVGKLGKDDLGKYKDEWLEDINLDVTEISSLFQNSKICQYNQKLEESARVRWTEVNRRNDNSDVMHNPNNNGGYVKWKYTFNIDKSYISIDNDLKQYILLALKKSRIYNGSRVPVDNFDNLIQNIDFSQGIKPNNEKDDFTKSKNITSFNIRNLISRNECFSSVGIIAPYSINDGYYATFLEFGNHYNKEFTINFNKQNTEYYNIRFYLKCSQNKGIEIDTNLEELKIYTQSTNSDYDEVEKLAYNGLDLFILVLIIGKCSEDPLITFKYANTGNSSDYNSCIVRNIHLYLQETSDPFKTYAITTYYDDRVLVNCGLFTGDYMYTIGGGGKNYCYLPDPNYLISITTPVFKCDDQGKLKLNNKEYNIITTS